MNSFGIEYHILSACEEPYAASAGRESLRFRQLLYRRWNAASNPCPWQHWCRYQKYWAWTRRIGWILVEVEVYNT